jgi:hypothetical protein
VSGSDEGHQRPQPCTQEGDRMSFIDEASRWLPSVAMVVASLYLTWRHHKQDREDATHEFE